MRQTFYGAEWRLFLPHNELNSPNIVGQVQEGDNEALDIARLTTEVAKLVAGRICYVLLLQEGEDVLHPMVGIAPRLFDSLSSETSMYFVYHASKTLEKWNRLGFIGYQQMKMEIDNQKVYHNSIYVSIHFQPVKFPSNNVLTFGYFQPKVFHDKVDSMRELLKSLSLNGETFDWQEIFR